MFYDYKTIPTFVILGLLSAHGCLHGPHYSAHKHFFLELHRTPKGEARSGNLTASKGTHYHTWLNSEDKIQTAFSPLIWQDATGLRLVKLDMCVHRSLTEATSMRYSVQWKLELKQSTGQRLNKKLQLPNDHSVEKKLRKWNHQTVVSPRKLWRF